MKDAIIEAIKFVAGILINVFKSKMQLESEASLRQQEAAENARLEQKEQAIRDAYADKIKALGASDGPVEH